MSDESSIDSSDQEITSEDDHSDERNIEDSNEKAGVVATNEAKETSNQNNASKVQPGKKLQAKWEDMFERLLKYKAEYGHCLVPNRYAKDPQLGSWVSTQRRHYKILTSESGDTTPMTPARARKLEEIGFKWSTKDPRHVPWEHRYNQLVAFKERYGHSQVPIGWEENIKLSNWVSTQRQEYKLIQSGRQSRLSDDKIALLDDINFIWEAQRGGPRRQRKATVAVPSKPNPVDARKIKTKAATRGGKAGASIRRGHVSIRQPDEYATTNVEPASEKGKGEQELRRLNEMSVQQPQSSAFDSATLTGMNAGTGVSALMQLHGAYMPPFMPSGLSSMGAPGLQLGSSPRHVLNNGIFPSSIAHSAGLAGSPLFPLASRLQFTQPGFHFSHLSQIDQSRQMQQALGQLSSLPFGGSQIDPSRQIQQAVLGQFSSLQLQPHAASLQMNSANAIHGYTGLQNLQHLQLPHPYLQGNFPHGQAQGPEQNNQM